MINNADIYNETTLVNDIKKEYCSDAPEDALLLSTFGYFGELEARNLRNAIITQSELSNEVFYTRCKRDDSVILHSVANGITDINATPAFINILLGIKESDINSIMIGNTATIYKDCKIYIEDFEFHFDYNILITKSTINNGEIIYTARYDIGSNNELSDITNPYLQAPVIMNINKESYVFIYCGLRQVIYSTISSKIISNSSLENKMVDFEFEDQMATFYVDVIEDGVTTTLTPLLEGINLNSESRYCKYSYIDSNTIRVIFDPNSYTPGLNASIFIRVLSTKGAEGNFEYNTNLISTLESETGNYKNIPAIIKIQSNSTGGKDRKSTEELQSILPKEALSKGTISIYKGLENCFNTFNTSAFKIKLEQRADNNAMRTYFAYLAMKDINENVVPTNTITASILDTEFTDTDTDGIYVIPQGSYVLLNKDDPEATIKLSATTKDVPTADFVYTIPFMTVINYTRSYIAYYSTLINQSKMIYFRDINQESELQFIATTASWKREYLTDTNTYKLALTLSQNVSYEYGLVETTTGEDGLEHYTSKIRLVGVMYNDDGEAYRYTEATLTKYDPNEYSYSFLFEFVTDDSIDTNNNIRINNVKELLTETEAYGYFSSNIGLDIFVLLETEENFGRYELDTYIPNLENYGVSNVYKINEGLDFFINYSEIINSVVSFSETTTGDSTTAEKFTIKSLPVVKRSYLMRGEEYIQNLMNNISQKKEFIDDVRYNLDNNFTIDMKFFNTYGPSKRFIIDSNNTLLDRVNIVPKFIVRTLENADKTVISKIKKEIKSLVEDLTPYTLPSLHFVKIAGTVYNKYKDSIDFCQCVAINDYGPEVQYLERVSSNDILSVPEFVCIDEDEEGNPNIIIS